MHLLPIWKGWGGWPGVVLSPPAVDIEGSSIESGIVYCTPGTWQLSRVLSLSVSPVWINCSISVANRLFFIVLTPEVQWWKMSSLRVGGYLGILNSISPLVFMFSMGPMKMCRFRKGNSETLMGMFQMFPAVSHIVQDQRISSNWGLLVGKKEILGSLRSDGWVNEDQYRHF